MISVNGEPFRPPSGPLTITALLREIDAPDRGVAVAVDSEVVPKGQWESFVLADEACVEVVTAVQGG